MNRNILQRKIADEKEYIEILEFRNKDHREKLKGALKAIKLVLNNDQRTLEEQIGVIKIENETIEYHTKKIEENNKEIETAHEIINLLNEIEQG